ncbi:hypothetical protein [Methyloversatilis sp.]|uniref:hypothetical protein n=1 Tax=Methyloversatilis sp. TaxID=2569862 RepID=UPI0035B06FD8
MTDKQPAFGIGTTYRTRGKSPRECMVTDVLRTYDAFGNLISIRYVAVHKIAGQMVAERDVVETTIRMGLMQEVPFIGVPMIVGENTYTANVLGEEHEHA